VALRPLILVALAALVFLILCRLVQHKRMPVVVAVVGMLAAPLVLAVRVVVARVLFQQQRLPER
jgi:hypothetical protein